MDMRAEVSSSKTKTLFQTNMFEGKGCQKPTATTATACSGLLVLSCRNLLLHQGLPKAEWHLEVRGSGPLGKTVNCLWSLRRCRGTTESFPWILFLEYTKLRSGTAAAQGDPWGLRLHLLALPWTTAKSRRGRAGIAMAQPYQLHIPL